MRLVIQTTLAPARMWGGLTGSVIPRLKGFELPRAGMPVLSSPTQDVRGCRLSFLTPTSAGTGPLTQP